VVERNVDAMVEAIRDWEMEAGEGFTDYFLDNWPLGSWAYWLLGKGHTEWANTIINASESKKYVDQDTKFMWFDDYADGDWSEEAYRKNVRVWAEFLVESDQYFSRVSKFFDEYFNGQEGELN
jgi:hypothetical protein